MLLMMMSDDDDGRLRCSHTLWLFCWCFFSLFSSSFYYFVMKRRKRPSKRVQRICITRFFSAIPIQPSLAPTQSASAFFMVVAGAFFGGKRSSAATVAVDAYERQCTIYLFFYVSMKPHTFRASARSHTRDGWRRAWVEWVWMCVWCLRTHFWDLERQ